MKKINIALAPIIVFVFNRLSETKLTIEALKENHLSSESELYIFSDGPRKETDVEKVQQVRDYIHSIIGFKTIHIMKAEKNKGLAKSIIDGVSEVIKLHGRVIVLEDDLVTSRNFLNFMNEALHFYQDNDKIISISGYSPNLKSLKTLKKDYYFTQRISSLGWGTWENKWETIDWEISDYDAFKKDTIKKYKWFRIGSDLPGMLKNQMEGKINSWAIRWAYHQFKYELITVYTSSSKVNHIGDGEEATNAKDQDRFYTELDSSDKRTFEFENKLILDKRITRDFKNNYSILKRLKYKVKALLKI